MRYASLCSKVVWVELVVSNVVACKAYDAELLEPGATVQAQLVGECGDRRVGRDELCDIAIPAGEPGACPSDCSAGKPCIPETMVGTDCNRRCVFTFITRAVSGDGCCLPESAAQEDSDCGFCGDSIVSPTETCDPPETCPQREDCAAEDPCITATFAGDAALCTARCEYATIARCKDGDGCCARACNAESDKDCSLGCGDGFIDPSKGETCEPGDADHPCNSACDDGDPCTQDLQTGAPENCNVACSHIGITERHAGDGCCPSGAAWRDDHDCPAVCGNDRVEGGEACDGGEDCKKDCTLNLDSSSLDAEQSRCLGFSDTEATDQCKRCICERCTSQALDCYASGDPVRDARCGRLAECGHRNGCYDFSCYCGGTSCIPADGPCRRETEEAAGATDVGTILRCYSDPSCASNRARQLGECLATECASVCD